MSCLFASGDGGVWVDELFVLEQLEAQAKTPHLDTACTQH